MAVGAINKKGASVTWRLSPHSLWPETKWRFSDWPRPWVIETNAWRFEWRPGPARPPGSNPSTRLFIHVYPLGVVSVGLTTAVGFGSGIEIAPFISLLKRMMPSQAGEGKTPWLRVTVPEAFAGMPVTLDRLAESMLGEMLQSWFETPDPRSLSERAVHYKPSGLRSDSLLEPVRSPADTANYGAFTAAFGRKRLEAYRDSLGRASSL